MEKIVLVTDHPEQHDGLLACLKMLFPECDIQIVSGPIESFGDAPVALDSCGEGK